MQSRRRFVQGLAAGTVAVLGWSPLRGSWIATASADEPFEALPPLDGSVAMDPATLHAFTEDFGRIRFRTPTAVLHPGSIDDVVKVVRFARAHRLQVAMNGQAGTNDQRESHSQFGQAQAKGGIVIDVKPLSTIYGIDSGARLADVGAGVRWSELFDAAEAFGLAPVVMNDYMHLSVGGTLSVGGIGGHTHRFGTQADNVAELEVVTGLGERVICSPTRRRDLFEAALAGCGQSALIVRARVRLAPTESHALVFNLFYDDAATYVRDQQKVVGEGRFDYQEGQIARREDDTGWRYMMEVVKYYTPPAAPDPVRLLAGLSDDRASAQIVTQTFRQWQFRIDPFVAFLKVASFWQNPHPWLSVWIPGSSAAAFAEAFTARLRPSDLGPGVALLYPINTRRVDRPLFRLPREPVAFHLSLLRFPPDDPAVVSAMLADNRRIYDEVVALGGTRYVIGAIPEFTRHDWQTHFQPRWGFLTRSKHTYDRDNVLTPGWGMFG